MANFCLSLSLILTGFQRVKGSLFRSSQCSLEHCTASLSSVHTNQKRLSLTDFQINVSHFPMHFPFFSTAQRAYWSLILGVPSGLCPDLSKHTQVSFWEIYTDTSYQHLSERLHHYGISHSQRLSFMKLWIARIYLPLFTRLSALYFHSFDLFYIIKNHQRVAKINLITLNTFS